LALLGGKKASIIIPAHTSANNLEYTLQALSTQAISRTLYEIVVISDAPSVVMRDIISRFATSPEIRYLEVQECCVSAARNMGIRLAKHEVIIFLDEGVIPSRDFVRIHLEAHDNSKSVAAIGYTFGLEITPETFPLWVSNPNDWDFATEEELFDKAGREPDLKDWRDLRVRLADGGLASMPAPWAFFWTCNASASKEKLVEVGLFDERFECKGSEDLELGYRLYRGGCRFEYLRNALAFHCPHQRDRSREIQLDRKNETYFLRKFPVIEVEALVSFDCANMNYVLPHISALANLNRSIWALGKPPLQDLGFPLDCVKNLLVGCGSTLLFDPAVFEAGLEIDLKTLGELRHHFPHKQFYQLLGISTPYEDFTFDAVVISDIWRHLPEALLSRLLQEAARIGKRVFLLKNVELVPKHNEELFEAILRYDRPYWERETYLSRSVDDFNFVTNGPANQWLLIEALPRGKLIGNHNSSSSRPS